MTNYKYLPQGGIPLCGKMPIQCRMTKNTKHINQTTNKARLAKRKRWIIVIC